MHADKYFNLHETIRSIDRLLQVTWVPFRLLSSPTVTVSCEWNLALWTLLGFLMALTSVAVKLPLDILTVCELGRNEMGSLDGIWFPAIHWRACIIWHIAGEDNCLPRTGSLPASLLYTGGQGDLSHWCWKYSCMYETENYSNEHIRWVYQMLAGRKRNQYSVVCVVILLQIKPSHSCHYRHSCTLPQIVPFRTSWYQHCAGYLSWCFKPVWSSAEVVCLSPLQIVPWDKRICTPSSPQGSGWIPSPLFQTLQYVCKKKRYI